MRVNLNAKKRAASRRNPRRGVRSVRRRRKAPKLTEHIARLGEQGKDVSGFFTNRGRMMSPLHTIEVDFPADLLAEVDLEAAALRQVSEEFEHRSYAEGPRRPIDNTARGAGCILDLRCDIGLIRQVIDITLDQPALAQLQR